MVMFCARLHLLVGALLLWSCSQNSNQSLAIPAEAVCCRGSGSHVYYEYEPCSYRCGYTYNTRGGLVFGDRIMKKVCAEHGTTHTCEIIGKYPCTLSHENCVPQNPYIDHPWWTKWTACTAKCEGGVRHPTVMNHQHTEYLLQCNTQACHKQAECGQGRGSVVFLLDSSSSITISGWYRMKQFVIDVIQGLPHSSLRVGVIRFSSSAHRVVPLDQYPLSVLESHIWSLQYTPQSTNTAAGIQELMQLYTEDVSQRRHRGEPRIGIVITDGHSNNAAMTAKWAKQAKRPPTDIVLYAVGIGRRTEGEELRAIATRPDYVHYIADFTALSGITNNITTALCQRLQEAAKLRAAQTSDDDTMIAHKANTLLHYKNSASQRPQSYVLQNSSNGASQGESDERGTTVAPDAQPVVISNTAHYLSSLTDDMNNFTDITTAVTPNAGATVTTDTTVVDIEDVEQQDILYGAEGPDCSVYSYRGRVMLRFFPDTVNCAKFYICERISKAEHRRHDQYCPSGTAWVQDVLACNIDKSCNRGINDTHTNTYECDLASVPGEPSMYVHLSARRPVYASSSATSRHPGSQPGNDLQQTPGAPVLRQTLSAPVLRRCPTNLVFDSALCACTWLTAEPKQPTSVSKSYNFIDKECLMVHLELDGDVDSDTEQGGHVHGELYGPHIYTNNSVHGQAVMFDGTQTSVKLDYFYNWFTPARSAQFSLSLWVFPSEESMTSPLQGIIGNGDCTGYSTLYVGLEWGALAVEVYTDRFYKLYGGKLHPSRWHNVVLTIGEKIMKLYVNGKMVAQSEIIGNLKNQHCGVDIGHVTRDKFYHYTGIIDEVKFLRCTLHEGYIETQYQNLLPT